jgi:hypothetical protein
MFCGRKWNCTYTCAAKPHENSESNVLVTSLYCVTQSCSALALIVRTDRHVDDITSALDHLTFVTDLTGNTDVLLWRRLHLVCVPL